MSRGDFALPENIARDILERASRIDAGNDSRIAIDELRRTAQEAGISGHAFDAAVTEMVSMQRGAAVPTSNAQRDQFREESALPKWKQAAGWVRSTVIGVSTTLLGVITASNVSRILRIQSDPNNRIGGMYTNPDEVVFGMAAMIGVALLGLAWHDRESGDHRRFQISNVIAWCGFYLGWMMSTPLGGGLAAVVALWGLGLTAIAGAIVMSVRSGKSKKVDRD